ncbi:MAG: hypothetical protein DRH30_15030 [Deltaproteobacteria bacterium]|nr:MAG: hypothetical protein DRH30_15030 [Deltaproteobacteria bacterium]
MTTERVSDRWPSPPDVDGFSKEYAEIVKNRQLPFDAEDPLIFHVLTSLDEHSEGEREILDAMKNGGILMPVSRVEEKWGGGRGMVFPRDEAAGDADYLFMTPCNVTSGLGVDMRYRPAVAFRLSYIVERAQVAFRVHDMEPSYKRVEQMLVDDPEFDFDDDTEMSEKEQEAIRDEYIAETVSEELQGVAECGTQWDAGKSLLLTKLYAKMLSEFRNQRYGTIPDDNPARLEIFETAGGLFPDCISEIIKWGPGHGHWTADLFIGPVAEDLASGWESLFLGPPTALFGFPNLLFSTIGAERPEFLVKGELPLCDAAFYRDGQQQWLPVPAEVCDAGRGAAE